MSVYVPVGIARCEHITRERKQCSRTAHAGERFCTQHGGATAVPSIEQCARCGRTGADKHHIIRRDDGGLDVRDNIAPLCEACHKEWHMTQEGHIEFAAFLLTMPPALVVRFMSDVANDAMTLGELKAFYVLTKKGRQ